MGVFTQVASNIKGFARKFVCKSAFALCEWGLRKFSETIKSPQAVGCKSETCTFADFWKRIYWEKRKTNKQQIPTGMCCLFAHLIPANFLFLQKMFLAKTQKRCIFMCIADIDRFLSIRFLALVFLAVSLLWLGIFQMCSIKTATISWPQVLAWLVIFWLFSVTFISGKKNILGKSCSIGRFVGCCHKASTLLMWLLVTSAPHWPKSRIRTCHEFELSLCNKTLPDQTWKAWRELFQFIIL